MDFDEDELWDDLFDKEQELLHCFSKIKDADNFLDNIDSKINILRQYLNGQTDDELNIVPIDVCNNQYYHYENLKSPVKRSCNEALKEKTKLKQDIWNIIVKLNMSYPKITFDNYQKKLKSFGSKIYLLAVNIKLLEEGGDKNVEYKFDNSHVNYSLRYIIKTTDTNLRQELLDVEQWSEHSNLRCLKEAGIPFISV